MSTTPRSSADPAPLPLFRPPTGSRMSGPPGTYDCGARSVASSVTSSSKRLRPATSPWPSSMASRRCLSSRGVAAFPGARIDHRLHRSVELRPSQRVAPRRTRESPPQCPLRCAIVEVSGAPTRGGCAWTWRSTSPVTRRSTRLQGIHRGDRPAGGCRWGRHGPRPFDLFLVSLGTCAGIFVLQFMQQRDLSTEGAGLAMRIAERDPRPISSRRSSSRSSCRPTSPRSTGMPSSARRSCARSSATWTVRPRSRSTPPPPD